MPKNRDKVDAGEKSVVETTEHFESDTKSVTVTKGFTRNQGDHNFARVEVSVTLPIQHTHDDIKKAKATINILSTICDDALDRELVELKKHEI